MEQLNSKSRRPTISDPTDELNFFDNCLICMDTSIGQHVLSLLTEKEGSREEMIEILSRVVRDHYVSPEITAKRLTELGSSKTAAILKDKLPTSKKARSGDIGEILAAEYVEHRLSYKVPIRRLQWKDGRNMALRGDDIVAVTIDSAGRLQFLKGESKSRAVLSASVVTAASDALDRDRGHPTRHTVLFIADRLRDQGKDDLAKQLEDAVLASFHRYRIEHLLFTLSGNTPDDYLSDHLKTYKNKRRRYAVGIQLNDHVKLIEDLYSVL